MATNYSGQLRNAWAFQLGRTGSRLALLRQQVRSPANDPAIWLAWWAGWSREIRYVLVAATAAAEAVAWGPIRAARRVWSIVGGASATAAVTRASRRVWGATGGAATSAAVARLSRRVVAAAAATALVQAIARIARRVSGGALASTTVEAAARATRRVLATSEAVSAAAGALTVEAGGEVAFRPVYDIVGAKMLLHDHGDGEASVYDVKCSKALYHDHVSPGSLVATYDFLVRRFLLHAHV